METITQNKYPYTDFHELNLDWIISEMKSLDEQMKEVMEHFKEYETLLAQANAYTDQQITAVKALITNNENAIKNLESRLVTEVARLDIKIDDTADSLQADINTKYLRNQQSIAQMWEDMKNYIAGQVIDVKVRNFFTGQLVSIQSMFDYLAKFHLDSAGDYDTVSGHNTYAHYVAQNKSYEYVVTNSATFFV